MTLVASTESLELPAFSADEYLFHGNALHNIPQATDARVLRLCAINVPDGAVSDIGQLLDITEREHTILRDEHDLPVVDHEWGFYPVDAVPHPAHFSMLTGCIRNEVGLVTIAPRIVPPGWLLAAKVAVVEPATFAPAHEIKHLKGSTNNYRYRAGRDLFIYDVAPHQFVYGKTRTAAPSQSSSSILVDIEPRLRYRS